MASAQSSFFGNTAIGAIVGTLATVTTLTVTNIAPAANQTWGGYNLTEVGVLSGTTLQVDGTATVTTLTGATSAFFNSGALIIPDMDGGGCSEIRALNGTLSGDTVACP